MTEHDEPTRASGKTAAEEVTAEESAELTEQVHPQLPDERERRFQTAGMSRMKFSFNSEEQMFLAMARREVDKQLDACFGEAYQIMHRLYSLVREPVRDAHGNPVKDERGLVQWQRDENGMFIEDWTRLTHREREQFLFQITTRLVAWEQNASDAWLESMYAKLSWEQSFAAGYEDSGQGKDTIEGRTARGKLAAREDHFLAVFKTHFSRKAEALVRSMERLSQRLKDIHVANGSR